MSAALMLEPTYRHVESREVVRDVLRLLRIDAPDARAGSLVLSGEGGVRGNLMSLKGLGKEIWAGVDAQEYVNELRRERSR